MSHRICRHPLPLFWLWRSLGNESWSQHESRHRFKAEVGAELLTGLVPTVFVASSSQEVSALPLLPPASQICDPSTAAGTSWGLSAASSGAENSQLLLESAPQDGLNLTLPCYTEAVGTLCLDQK